MTDWFRSWHGAPTDPKWLGIARKAGVAPGIAVAISWALMDRASQADDRGSIAGYDPDGLACFFGCEPEQVDAVVSAMEEKGVLHGGRFTSWEKRQPKREDSSTQRVQAHRERQKAASERDETLCNASETRWNAPDTDTDTDTEKNINSLPSEAHSPTIDAQAPKRTQGRALPEDWVPNEKHRAEAVSLGRDTAWLDRQADAMRLWAASNRNRQVARKADWDLTFLGWLRREHERNPIAQPRASPSWAPVDTKGALERAMAKAGVRQ